MFEWKSEKRNNSDETHIFALREKKEKSWYHSAHVLASARDKSHITSLADHPGFQLSTKHTYTMLKSFKIYIPL